ncbi:MAG: acyl-CoA dehydrogenase [Acidimicrobiia bacterium]|nr:acyl-CoA dehydrogenase [Acidimicrobiia bacterium]
MDFDELSLFRESLRQATEAYSGKALDDALDELGWRDALVADRRSAVSTLFDLQGQANASSSAIDTVMAAALGIDGPVALPPLGSREQPTTRGLGTPAFANRAPAGVTVRSLAGIDPALGLVEVVGDLQSLVPRIAWSDALAAGQLALGHELVGASRMMLQLARGHAVERVQFGRPIAAFQAVRHRLAESLVAVEAAAGALDAAWEVGSPQAAATAKAVAGRNARVVARHCQQVLAGIGFTTEHPFHRYLRRALVLDALLGDARTLIRQLGDDLVRTRRLPPLLPL